MAPWSSREECRKDHAYCTQLADFYGDNEVLRARIATLEAQVEQAREALEMSIERCQWRGRSDETCRYPFDDSAHCNVDAPCWLWGALREGGKNAE